MCPAPNMHYAKIVNEVLTVDIGPQSELLM
jgi:hypothetical protein